MVEDLSIGGRHNVDMELPDAATMATFDTLEIDMTSDCDEDPNNFSCGEWDYNGGLYICDQDDPETCNTIFGRWVTTYARAGRWVWDVSPMMALIADGGTLGQGAQLENNSIMPLVASQGAQRNVWETACRSLGTLHGAQSHFGHFVY